MVSVIDTNQNKMYKFQIKFRLNMHSPMCKILTISLPVCSAMGVLAPTETQTRQQPEHLIIKWSKTDNMVVRAGIQILLADLHEV